MSTAIERVEVEALKSQIEHLRSKLGSVDDLEESVESLKSELQAVRDAYPWDHGKGESTSSLMINVAKEAKLQEDRAKHKDSLLEEIRKQIVKRDDFIVELRSKPQYKDLRERYRQVLREARRAGQYLSIYGSASHHLFPHLREAIQDLDTLEEK